eukprot:TRINITY_DN33522_c0_g1_i5.p2 TRINITY_DN33522_c0_g1~~TRINITY_DN33522_c0_g1_i5.p2  ORF type:complete len:302 (-),score=42.99 TRINITY_DN33522_c0_g1_i5:1048-1926(-)
MKIIAAVIVACVAFAICGQPSELICFSLPPLPQDPVAARSSLTDLQPLLEQASELTVTQLEGLSIEQAAQMAPEIFNNTSITLFKQALERINNGDLTTEFKPTDIVQVTFESFMNAPNGVEIINTMLQKPENFARLFLTVVRNFDQDCIDYPNLLYLTFLTNMMSYLLQEPFRNSFVDVFNTTVVIASIQGNLTDTVISVLEPLSENLEAAENVDEALASLSSFVTKSSINVALANALKSSSDILNPQQVRAVLIAFFGRIQKSFEIDGQEFVIFMNNIFKGILAALNEKIV